MIIPNSSRKKALVIVDVQPDFIDTRNEYIIENIVTLVEKVEYDMYVEAVFHTEPNSIWKKQTNYECLKSQNTCSVVKIQESLEWFKAIKIQKQTKSIFKWDIDILSLLKQNEIEEIHFVWVETNDCIMASVYESFDLGFFSYAIEECCEWPNNKLHKEWINVMRRVKVTNNSIVEDIDTITIAI